MRQLSCYQFDRGSSVSVEFGQDFVSLSGCEGWGSLVLGVPARDKSTCLVIDCCLDGRCFLFFCFSCLPLAFTVCLCASLHVLRSTFNIFSITIREG